MFYVHEAKVEGPGRFPVDMLRYDACYPASAKDTNEIEHSLERCPRKPYQVTVQALSSLKIHWTPERWRSFGAVITESTSRKARG